MRSILNIITILLVLEDGAVRRSMIKYDISEEQQVMLMTIMVQTIQQIVYLLALSIERRRRGGIQCPCSL